MVDPELVRLAVMFLAALSVGGVAYVLVMPFLSDERKASKRFTSVAQGGTSTVRRAVAPEAVSARKTQVQDTLKEIEARQKSRKKKKLTMRSRLLRAGLNVPVRSFYIASAISGLVFGAVVLVSGSSLAVSGLVAIAGGLGFPRWLLKFMAKRRQKQFLAEFANATDVIVRGVKSGLPLNDCLKIIAQEGAEPVRSEFVNVVEQQSVGVPFAKIFERMYDRMPLQEVNFFAIVITIQQQTGGNLAEALDNLSQVLRGRQRLNGKVQSLSAEAKTSAMILGALPPIVMGAMSAINPNYMMLLWTEQLGKMMLLGCAIWMLIGVLVMRKMINFDY